MSSALNTLIEAMNDVDPLLEKAARAELAALRKRIGEAENSAYASKSEYGVLSNKLRAENAELRESLRGAECAADDLRASVSELTAQNAEQARKLSEARELVNQSLSDVQGIINMNDDKIIDQMLDHLSWSLASWLAAPAPQVEQEQTK